jgi:hypothetical protein
MGRLLLAAIFRLEPLRSRGHIPAQQSEEWRLLIMPNPSWDQATTDGYDDPPERGLDRYDPCEIDPPAPLQMFTRLGLLLMISLAFGLAAELLVRLPAH